VTTATWAGGVFGEIHRRRVGALPDLAGLRPPEALLPQARATWQERFQTELRSVQVMTRFLTEVVGAGDPIDIYAGALELVEDEIAHVALSEHVCRALGVAPRLPEPMRLDEPEAYLRAPMVERALHTAIAMLAVSETLSTGYIADLRDRCAGPLRAVLDAVLGDEEGHQAFGWAYVERGLARFPKSTLPDWRHLVRSTLAQQQTIADRVLAGVPPARQTLEAWPDVELAAYGLFHPVRQALVLRRTVEQELTPRLARLSLA
jgi:hypothetical protein